MNNKYLSIFIIGLLACMLCMGVVCAKDSMKNQKFGKEFKMDVPNDSKFAQQALEADENEEVPLNEKVYFDEKTQIMIDYANSSMFSENNTAIFYQYVFESINVDLNQSYEYQEGDIRVIEPVTKSNLYFSMVGVTSGNQIVLLFGDDVNLMKKMAHSIEFL